MNQLFAGRSGRTIADGHGDWKVSILFGLQQRITFSEEKCTMCV
jgi:hypothetical protein